MSVHPWDIPPFPTHGDMWEQLTYAAVGRAMSRWEAVEVEFAQLYALLCGGDRFDETLSQEYGEKDNFRARLIGLNARVCRYFIAHPDQRFEAKMRRVLADAGNFSARRNDIAHGIVRPFRWQVMRPQAAGTGDHPPFEWCLVPSHFRAKNFANARPRYLLASKEIGRFADGFFGIQRAVNDLVHRLLGLHPSCE